MGVGWEGLRGTGRCKYVVCGVATPAEPVGRDVVSLWDPRAPESVVCPRPTTSALDSTKASRVRSRAGRARVCGAGVGFYVSGQ